MKHPDYTILDIRYGLSILCFFLREVTKKINDKKAELNKLNDIIAKNQEGIHHISSSNQKKKPEKTDG